VHPELGQVKGFILDGDGNAITANWVRSDGIWHVDTAHRRSTLKEYADAAGHAQAHSVIAHSSPVRRLQALAAYLGLDWGWLRRRCAQLHNQRWEGLIQPRSRLLSLSGLEHACGFIASLPETRP
jgi:hypothetical protein